MGKALKQEFYDGATEELAQELLGKLLCRKTSAGLYAGKIVETEAYLGERDAASHASKGRTKRNEIMFKEPGRAYVYMIYGMYYCLNVVTEKNGIAGAVLIRALEPVVLNSQKIKSGQTDFTGKDIAKILNGPGKLCREFEIGKDLNGSKFSKKNGLWLEEGEHISPARIFKTKRIGVEYAGEWKDKLFRFYIKDNKFVSKKLKTAKK